MTLPLRVLIWHPRQVQLDPILPLALQEFRCGGSLELEQDAQYESMVSDVGSAALIGYLRDPL